MYRNRRPKKPTENVVPKEVVEDKNTRTRSADKPTVVTSTPLTVVTSDNARAGSSGMNSSRLQSQSARKRRSGEDDDMFETPSKVGTRGNTTGRAFPFPSPAMSTIDRVSPSAKRRSQSRPEPRIQSQSQALGLKKQEPFVDMLKKAGLRLVSDGPYILEKDQTYFVKSLQKLLKADNSYPANIAHFLNGFEDYLNDNLNKALESTTSGDNLTRKPAQECLLRLLLNVDSIQPRLWKILFDRMAELIMEEERNDESFELVNKILRQMRCLDQVLEGDVNNCDKLLELISLSNMEDTQREIILVIPDVIRDDDREKAVLKISENIMLHQTLIPAYLETLAIILPSTDDARVRVIEEVTEAISVVGVKYFQVIMKFLIAVADDMGPLIKGIRSTVKLNPQAMNKDGNEAYIFANTLKEADDPKNLIETWISEIEESETSELLPVDLVALLVFSSTRITRTKAAIMSAFKLQALRGPPGEVDVDKAFSSIQTVLEQEYLDSMLEILSPLFKSKVPAHSQYACFWYRLLILRIKSRHTSLKVLETILLLINYGSPDQVTSAIGILQDAATFDMDSIARHAHRVVSLLQCIEDWELQQVRDLMALLMSMIFGSSLASNQQDTVIIRIRKMLSISNIRVVRERPSAFGMSYVRPSKVRHVFGSNVKRDQCYNNIRVSKSSLDSLACAVNPKFLAVIVESGGGAFIVIPLTKYGRVPADHPMVEGHKGYITDIAFCPHDDNVIASASDDCLVKVWQIPDGGLVTPMHEPVVDLVYHQRRVNLVLWHPTAFNVLLSAGSDNKVAIWNVGTGEVINTIDSHPDVVFSACWNWNGSMLLTTCKDKKLRLFDPRTSEILEEAVCHEGSKATRAVFLKSGQIFTTGFSKMSEWQYSLREPGRLSEPLCLESNDSTNGIIFPLYDPDTNMVYLCGKGDSLIRYFEISGDSPYVHYINLFNAGDPQRSVGMMPKRGCDVRKCEVASFYRLNTAGHCQVVSMTCPRKSELFQEDLFPDTLSLEPALTADEWIQGHDADPVLMSLRFGNPARLDHLHVKQPNILNKPRSTSFVDIVQTVAAESKDAKSSDRLSSERVPKARPRSQSIGDGLPESAIPMASSRSPMPRRRSHVPDDIPIIVQPQQYSRRQYAQLLSMPKCRACDEVITDEEYTRADDHTYHVVHFACSSCDKPLAGNEYHLIVDKELPLCLECYEG